MIKNFNAALIAKSLKEETKENRRRPYSKRKSKLDHLSVEIIELKKENVKNSEIQRWLSTQKIKVDHRTISRWLEKNYRD